MISGRRRVVRVGGADLFEFPGDLLLEVEAVEDPPEVSRQAVADLGGNPVEAVDRLGQAPGPVAVEEDRGNLLLDHREPPRGVLAARDRRRGAEPGPAGESVEEVGKLGAFGRARRVGQPDQDPPGQADLPLDALDVAAEPVEVVGRAAGEVTAVSAELDQPDGRRQKAEVADRAIGEDPGVLAPAPLLHRDDQGVSRRGDPGQATGHEGVAVLRGGQEVADDQVAGAEVATREDRSAGEPQLLLADIIPSAWLGSLRPGPETPRK